MKGKLKPFLINVFGYTVIGSSCFIADQILKVYRKVEKATSTDVLSIDRFQPVYIYIDDPFIQGELTAHVRLTKEKVKVERFHKWLYNKIEGSFLVRKWLSYRNNLAWRYLNLAQEDCRDIRARAVRSLASLTNLSESDYRQLAQALDMRTAIGLARSTNNTKFLLDPPYFRDKPNYRAMIKSFHEIFKSLESEAHHPCFQYFVTKVVNEISDQDNKGFDDDFSPKLENADIVPMCLEALLHHSWTSNNARQIVRLGGLYLLTEVYKYVMEVENLDALILLSKLVSNISVCSDCAEDFFRSGWIKLLSILAAHKDIRVSAPAQKALCNFDTDDPGQKDVTAYSSRIFPLHPVKRTSVQPKLDVIFIHGLLGGIFVTWRQREMGYCTPKSPLELLGFTGAEEDVSYQTTRPLDSDFFVDVRDLNNWEKTAETYEFVLADIPVDESNPNSTGPFYGNSKVPDCCGKQTKCWPKDWLAHDCPEIRLIGVNYDTNISKWTPLCPLVPMTGTLKERSGHLLNILLKAGVGKRPIVWIGHSMGGLIAKGILSISYSSTDPAARSIYEQTKGVVFYSTPHKGSHLAALNSTSQLIVWPSIEVQELRENSPGLLKLHEEFVQLVKERPIQVITFAERESTYITSLKFEIQFVNAYSADPDVGETFGIPLDHLCICKPAGKQSFLYQKVKNMIQNIITNETKRILTRTSGD